MLTGGLALRQRTAGECVDLGLALLREDGPAVLRRTAPLGVIAALMAGGTVWLAGQEAGLVMALLLSPALGGPSLRLAMARAVGQAETGGTDETGREIGGAALAHLRADLRDALRLLRQALWAGPLCAVFGVLIMPIGFYLWSVLVFLPEVRLVEQASLPVTRARELSRLGMSRLMAARFWCAVLYLFGVSAAEGMGQLVVGELLQLGAPWGRLQNGEITPYVLAGVLLCGPVWAMIRFAFYLDLRTRTESLDVFFALWQASERRDG